MSFKSLRGIRVIAFANSKLTLRDGDGLILDTVSLPEGPLDMTPYHPLTDFGLVELEHVYVTNTTVGRVQRMVSGDRFDTAANPNFQVSSAERSRQELQRMINSAVQANSVMAETRRAEQARRREDSRVELDATKVIEEDDTPSPDDTIELKGKRAIPEPQVTLPADEVAK